MFYFDAPEKALLYAGESCKAIHNTDLCISCAEYFVGLILGALNGVDKSVLKNFDYSPVEGWWQTHTMHSALLPIAKGSYDQKEKSQLGIKYGYVVDSLEVALW